tara:strand:+ start:318 stop:614 length:297 start_codon:yes stop_codon:yes gene_type:complete
MAYRRNNKKSRGWSKDNRRKEEVKTNVKSRRPSHVTVVPKKGEHPERMVKRFLKKCKKIKIIEEYRKKEYFEKPSAKKRRMKLRSLARIKKEALKNKE